MTAKEEEKEERLTEKQTSGLTYTKGRRNHTYKKLHLARGEDEEGEDVIIIRMAVLERSFLVPQRLCREGFIGKGPGSE